MSADTHCRQIWLQQCHREKPQMALQQLSMVSGSILLGKYKGQKKLQNLLQKQSLLEFARHTAPGIPAHHTSTDQKTVHRVTQKVSFPCNPILGQIYVDIEKVLSRGRKTKMLDIRHVLSSLTSKLPRLSLPHEDSRPALCPK